MSKCNHRTFYNSCPLGQSLSEYGMIFGLVSILSVGALTLLGQNLNSGFSAILPPPSEVAAPVAAETQKFASSGSDSKPTSQSGMLMQITLQNGRQIAISNYPNDFTETIETVGANGATDRLLAVLETLTRELLAKGEITETQASQLFALANTGHEIAAREKIVEDFVNTYKSQGLLPVQPLTYQGKTYPDISTFARTFDVTGSGTQGAAYKALSGAYNEALASGALLDPANKQVVESLVTQIGNLAQSLSEAVNASSKSKVEPNEILNRVVSTVTHKNSASICSTGKGSDTGITCSN